MKVTIEIQTDGQYSKHERRSTTRHRGLDQQQILTDLLYEVIRHVRDAYRLEGVELEDRTS